MQLVAALPPLSKTRVDLTNNFVDELWNSLQHPPLSYLGDQYAFRTGDGSYNVKFASSQRCLYANSLRISCIRTWEPQIPHMLALYNLAYFSQEHYQIQVSYSIA